MKTFLKYAGLTVVLAVIMHYTVQKAAIAGCKSGVYVVLDGMMGGDIGMDDTLDTQLEKFCRQVLLK